MKKILIMVLMGCVVGCGQGIPSDTSRSGDQSETLSFNRRALKICSSLETPQTGLTSLSPFQRSALLLALSISGSFEGSDGWQNLATDFDGQGLSMGLLNQNLGTGSLQPLLIHMRDNHLETIQKAFTPDQFIQLEEMLAQWQVDTSVIKRRVVYSSLDKPPQSQTDEPNFDAFEKANNQSAHWARSTLYKNSDFKLQWRTALQKLAQNKNYILQQLRAGTQIHRQTESLMKEFKLKSLRAYLFFFDINTQNGGLYPQDKAMSHAYLDKHPTLSEAEKLKTILSFRLHYVKNIYRSDVSSRKMAIIAGQGIVHGISRNLEENYCYKGSYLYFKD